MSADAELIDCTHCGESIRAIDVICRFCFSGLSKRHFQACPFCAEVIRKEADTCRFCQAELPESAVIEIELLDEAESLATFRRTFVTEITTLMSYSLGINDSLSMVARIVGLGCQASRCLIYCTHNVTGEGTGVWQTFEYWNRDEVESCKDLGWRASKSVLVAKTIMAASPLNIQLDVRSDLIAPDCPAPDPDSPAPDQDPDATAPRRSQTQEELNWLGVKSFIGVAMHSQKRTPGCLILQQCDEHRDWTKDEIDWIQSVANTLAESFEKKQ